MLWQNIFSNKCWFVLLACLCHSATIGQANKPLTSKSREFIYPDFNTIATDFSLLGPEMVLVSLAGGVYMAGTNVWYLMPNKERVIVSAMPNVTEECLYYLRLKKGNSGMQTSLHRLKKSGQQTQADEELARFDSNAMFQAFTVGQNNVFLVEKGETSQIWIYDGKQKKLIFKSQQLITAFCPINGNSCLLALGKEIILLQGGKEPKGLIGLKGPTLIDGICVNDKEEVYFSTYQGIWKVSGELSKKLKYELVIPKLHGSLKFLYPFLFVHVPKASTVVRLKVEN